MVSEPIWIHTWVISFKSYQWPGQTLPSGTSVYNEKTEEVVSETTMEHCSVERLSEDVPCIYSR